MRCYPYVIPFVGFSRNAEGENVLTKTIKNFTFCTNVYLRVIFDVFLKPFIIIIKEIVNSAHNIRVILNRFRHEGLLLRRMYSLLIKRSFEKVNRTRNTAIYLHEKMRDMVNKHQVSLDVLNNINKLYNPSIVGDRGILQKMYAAEGFPAMSPEIINKLGGGVEGVNYANTKEGLGGSSPPSACFDGNEEVEMFFGKKKIKDIVVGDYIKGGHVTAKIFINPLSNVDVYKYRGVIVSGSHLVFHEGKWERVCDTNESIKLNRPYALYCLITSSNLININNIMFRDYQETHNRRINKIINTLVENQCNNQMSNIQVLHSRPLYYWGFTGDTKIKVGNNFIPIKDIVKDGHYHHNILGGVILNGINVDIYNLEGIKVSGNTLVYKNKKWIRVYSDILAMPCKGESLIYNIFTSDNLIHVQTDTGLLEFRDFAESNNNNLNDKIDKLVMDHINTL